MKEFGRDGKKELFDFIFNCKNIGELNVYIGVDVGKTVLDVGITISNTDIKFYLGSVKNTAIGFKEIECFILRLIEIGIDENNIYFATENTGTYGHDITSFFEDRLPNVYILNSTLTYSARQFYAKNNFKNDEIDSIIIAMTLRDMDNKGVLETNNNKFKMNMGLGFIRRSMSKQCDTLRLLFRRLSTLRCEKSNIMTSINMYKERLFPEIRDIFKVKSRSKSQNILIENFTRNEILNMTENEFIDKYKSITPPGLHNKNIMIKVIDFYHKVHERGDKKSHSYIDNITGQTSDPYILETIKYNNKRYELIIQEIDSIKNNISNILYELKKKGYYIPSFQGIDNTEIGIFLGELGNQIYTIHISSLRGFIGWHPNNYTSGGGHMVKASKFSEKNSIIKKFIYIRMYGFNMHNPSFRLYKNLLYIMYGINTETDGIVKLKNKRKIEAKCGEKLLEIIHSCYRYKCGFDGNKFISQTVLPLIKTMKKIGISQNIIGDTILDVFNKDIPVNLASYCEIL